MFDVECDNNLLLKELTSRDIEWKIQNIDNPELPEYRLPDLVIDFKAIPYYGIFHSGFEVPKNTFSTIRDKIANENLMFGALLSSKGLIIPYTIYKMYGGNKSLPLIDKLKEDGCLTIPINEVVPNFQR